MTAPLEFHEFFAGGGMARLGLGPGWRCRFANDFDPRKAAAYAENWGDDHLRCADVAGLTTADLPGAVDLAWASFPCQDLSLAGGNAGLGSAEAPTRSGTFWPFWRLVTELRAEGRQPRAVMLENVTGLLRARQGRDFAALVETIVAGGYRVGAVVVDAVRFVPQSRPRVFVLALDAGLDLPDALTGAGPDPDWHPPALTEAAALLTAEAARGWLWWRLPAPPPRRSALADLLEPCPPAGLWHTPAHTSRLLDLMAPLHRARVAAAQAAGRPAVGCVYRRTRPDGQRAEARFDGIAGCLRTPAGGSSRQTLLLVDGDVIRSRLLSAREAARLMGLPDSYRLPARYNDAYRLAGDGVCAPVVRFLADALIEPALRSATPRATAAA